MIKSAAYLPLALVFSLILYILIPVFLVQMICAGYCFIVLISFVYIKILERNLKIERRVTQLKLSCKEKTEITFTIKNYSRLPVFTCYYFDQAPYFFIYNDKNQDLISLRPREVRQISYTVSAQERGLYYIGPVKIQTADPFGLFTLNFEVEAKLEVTVRPARIKLQTEIFPGIPQGNQKIKNPVFEDVTMRRSIREYKNGDEIKRINYRASAKFQKLFTNQYEDSYDVPVFVFLNLAEEDYSIRNRPYYTEKAIEIAANIVEHARKLKLACGFAAYAENFPFLPPKQNQWDYILDLLSVIKIEGGKLEFNPAKKYKNQLPVSCLYFEVGPSVVDYYFAKVEADIEDISTSKLGALKKL